MTEALPAPKPPRRRGLKIALVLSLAVNLMLIGLLAGGAMRAARLDEVAGGRPDLRALWRAMPDELRDQLRETARDSGLAGAHMRPDREARRDRAAMLNAALASALRAEPFDTQGFASLLAGDRDAAARRIDAAHQVLAGQIQALSAADRAALAARFEANLRGSNRR
jgi:uncharacterized membrane protein